jgi:hypothetical protein
MRGALYIYRRLGAPEYTTVLARLAAIEALAPNGGPDQMGVGPKSPSER